MGLCFRVLDRDGEHWRTTFAVDSVSVGRNRTADICLPSGNVSPLHCRFHRDDDGGVTIADLRSTAGTWCNGVRLEGPHRLKPQDLIEVAEYRLQLLDEAAVAAVDVEVATTPRLVALRRGREYGAVALDVDHLDSTIRIGSALECELRLDHPQVAALQMVFERGPWGFRVRSPNTEGPADTRVNDRPLNDPEGNPSGVNEAVVLGDGDFVTGGGCVFVLEGVGPHLSWRVPPLVEPWRSRVPPGRASHLDIYALRRRPPSSPDASVDVGVDGGIDPDAVGEDHERPTIGRYVVVGELGRGVGAVVHRVKDPDTGAHLAIRLTARDRVAGGHLPWTLFRAEPIHHPNLIRILEVRSVVGVPWVLMDLVGEGDIRSFVDGGASATDDSVDSVDSSVDSSVDVHHWQPPCPLPPKTRARLNDVSRLHRLVHALHQVLGGLSALHAGGWIHGDIRPSHLRVDDDGHLTIIDLSAATQVGDPRRELRVDFRGLAPEVSLARTNRNGHNTTDGRADIFSVGVVLYERLTGRHPFHGIPSDRPTVVAFLNATRREPPVSALNPEVHPELAILCARLMEKDPNNRPTAVEAHQALVALRKSLPPLPSLLPAT